MDLGYGRPGQLARATGGQGGQLCEEGVSTGGKVGKVGKRWHGGSPSIGGSWEKRKREGTKEGWRNLCGRDNCPGRRQQVSPFSPEIPFPLGQPSQSHSLSVPLFCGERAGQSCPRPSPPSDGPLCPWRWWGTLTGGPPAPLHLGRGQQASASEGAVGRQQAQEGVQARRGQPPGKGTQVGGRGGAGQPGIGNSLGPRSRLLAPTTQPRGSWACTLLAPGLCGSSLFSS